MPDIFISYKKEEREIAAQLATHLTEQGYDVWWDAALFAGSRFEDEISSVIDEARAVIVLWSRQSAVSDWVKAEAEAARSQNKALPAVIDDVPINTLPLLYRGMHIVHLRGWTGDPTHPGYVELLRSIVATCGAGGPSLERPAAEARLAEIAAEAKAWSEATTIDTPAAYRAYLDRYGAKARFAHAAQSRIAHGGRKASSSVPVPLIAALVAALVVILALGGWLLYGRGTPQSVNIDTPDNIRTSSLEQPSSVQPSSSAEPEPVIDVAARCLEWSKSGKLDWDTNLPLLSDTALDDCTAAAKLNPKDGDYLAYEAMALSLQPVNHNDEIGDLIDKSVALGSAVGTYMLGVTRPNAAEQYFQASADKGYARAAGRLCVLAEDEGGQLTGGADPNAYKAYCKSAAEAGDPFGQVGLGYIFENGKAHESIDENKAKALYKLAADQNFGPGKVMLGALLIRGRDVLHDFEKAFALFNEAAEDGWPIAYRWRGMAYEDGIGTHADIAKASRDYDTASFRYDQVAAMLIGDTPSTPYLHTGLADDEIARLMLARSAIGQRIKGAVLWQGYKQTPNFKLALAAFTACADQNALCQFQAGLFYYFGPSGLRDFAAARAILEKGAAQGEMRSQFLLAEMLRVGDGGPKDEARAQTLYEQSAAQGFYRAMDYLAQTQAQASQPKG